MCLCSDFGEEIIKKLKSTLMMQKVLRCMCRRRGEPDDKQRHGLYDGWGTLQPWEYLNDPNKLYSIIDYCTSNIEDIDWRGRNI